jgi:hypothetical protein
VTEKELLRVIRKMTPTQLLYAMAYLSGHYVPATEEAVRWTLGKIREGPFDDLGIPGES